MMNLSSRIRFYCLACLAMGTALAAGSLERDTLVIRQMAESLKVRPAAMLTKVEANRIVRLEMYYQGQQGPVPAALGELDSLRGLFISLTGVTGLPPEIGKLKRLDSVKIATSRIGPTLPDQIGDLPDLHFLQVNDNRLTSLPVSLMKLRHLQSVSFQGNAICQVDDSLEQWILAISPAALDRQTERENFRRPGRRSPD